MYWCISNVKHHDHLIVNKENIINIFYVSQTTVYRWIPVNTDINNLSQYIMQGLCRVEKAGYNSEHEVAYPADSEKDKKMAKLKLHQTIAVVQRQLYSQQKVDVINDLGDNASYFNYVSYVAPTTTTKKDPAFVVGFHRHSAELDIVSCCYPATVDAVRYAVNSNNVELVKFLCINRTDGANQEAMDAAINIGNVKIVRVLADFYRGSWDIAILGDLAILEKYYADFMNDNNDNINNNHYNLSGPGATFSNQHLQIIVQRGSRSILEFLHQHGLVSVSQLGAMLPVAVGYAQLGIVSYILEMCKNPDPGAISFAYEETIRYDLYQIMEMLHEAGNRSFDFERYLPMIKLYEPSDVIWWIENKFAIKDLLNYKIVE
ncbi:hypothetical protein PPL_02490 [Heterostelium album PN500]|uniref:Ankyrin repeat-containing protein n=1 Tax=Heterostelium pallidum (strain ATCC 26659 / Pp 5 / PN500) TaxID=670386 RepID=D3B282_HETP5|nr:hypothetical protein PPL_02490 [Heterostelium album PN500]EFA84457.1 hypothetical protein PPL_02490 [Heterostelium album PN500]|eukprot:XP_020436571.1 hypothetical protein PPL_02490 [Heterostelium album PN500]